MLLTHSQDLRGWRLVFQGPWLCNLPPGHPSQPTVWIAARVLPRRKDASFVGLLFRGETDKNARSLKGLAVGLYPCICAPVFLECGPVH